METNGNTIVLSKTDLYALIKNAILAQCLLEYGVDTWERWDDVMVAYHGSIGDAFDEENENNS